MKRIFFKNPSIVVRIIIGGIIGLILGIMTVDSISSFSPDISSNLKVCSILVYFTFGGIIGIIGISTKHPLLNFRLSWWIRSFLIGSVMHLILMFLAYDEISKFILTAFNNDIISISSFWFVPQGGFIGIIIGYLSTIIEGEDKPKYFFCSEKR